jgi:hypothetical protein
MVVSVDQSPQFLPTPQQIFKNGTIHLPRDSQQKINQSI